MVVAAGLVVLLVVCALVVDLGFSWMLRRQEQNAVDPAAIAAARWLKDSSGNARSPFPEAYEEACFYAQQNGFFNGDTADCSAARSSGQLQVYSPPISGPYVGSTGHVQVIIKDTHPSFFGRILGVQSSTVTTGAVAANTDEDANSSSLVALKPTCDAGSAGTVTGGGTVTIFPIDPTEQGGYVHVNSPCGGTIDDACLGGGGQTALDISGGGTLITPHAYTVGSCTVNGSGSNPDPDGLWCDDTYTSSACIDEGSLPLGDPLAGLPEPQIANFPPPPCPDPAEPNDSTATGCSLDASVCPVDASTGEHTCVLEPGTYYGGWFVKSNVTIQLRPGMYILAGGGIRAQSGAVIQSVESGTGIPPRVTIFSTDGPGCAAGVTAQCQDAITFAASAAFIAKATNTDSCTAIIAAGGPNGCPWRGILLWQDGTASHPDKSVTLGGQTSTILSGTIYAPLANVAVNGGNSTTGCNGPIETQSCLSIQIVSYTWKIDGDAEVDMPYDPKELFQLPQRGLVH
jgi:Flp pilus assembly protein TadG